MELCLSPERQHGTSTTALSKYLVHKVHYAAVMPLRVTLIDDDEVTTRGLISMLRAHPTQIELVRLTPTLTEPIDIALYDHALSRPGGSPTLAQLLSDTRIRKVALFTWNFQPWTAGVLIERGASAYLSKGLTSAELLKALHTVNTTDRGPVSPQARSTRARTANQADRGEVLTNREAEVLSLICRGLNNAEIAETVNLSFNTVKSYIRSCYRKIDVDSRSLAVLWGLDPRLRRHLGAARTPRCHHFLRSPHKRRPLAGNDAPHHLAAPGVSQSAGSRGAVVACPCPSNSGRSCRRRRVTVDRVTMQLLVGSGQLR